MSDSSVWTGRVDAGADGAARRWHQLIRPWQPGSGPGIAIAGFACDAGVVRNQGRPGAAAGPIAIRRALANLAWHGGNELRLFEAGDVACEGDQLEAAQRALAERVRILLADGQLPLLLGGGHEIAWGSYQGLAAHCAAGRERIGVINFDAHFDLRPLLAGDRGSSGTPFRQIAGHMAAAGHPVNYLCIGLARPANTPALYQTASELGVRWIEDLDCQLANLDSHLPIFEEFIASVDRIQLSMCLDAFPAGLAPGVSAPAGLGIPPAYVLAAIRAIGRIAGCGSAHGKLGLAEIAELCPAHDPAGVTARLAARIAFELTHTLYRAP
jgi:formiminoglutamase